MSVDTGAEGADQNADIDDGDDNAASSSSANKGKSSDTDDKGDKDFAAKVAALEKERDKWQTLARKHEGRAKQNAQAATESQTLQQQLDELKSQMAQRDVENIERAGQLALDSVNSRLSGAGIKAEQVAEVLRHIDPTALLTDGRPDNKTIDGFAKSIIALSARPTPDQDQGAKGGNKPSDMNALIRRAAGITSS